jgi:SAM-dependent methyltransferase
MSKAIKGDDNGGDFPTIESAEAYISGKAGSNTSLDYHDDRMRAIKLLLESIDLSNRPRVLDFGCGDAMYIKKFFQPLNISNIVGVDVSGPMIDIAKENLSDFNFEGLVGGIDALESIDRPFDILFAIDVLGYLDESELADFYIQAKRLVRPGGHLIVMYGNELFDMFAMNSGTSEFYKKHFNIDISDCLTEASAMQYKPSNRKNPLNFGEQLVQFGFKESEQAFSQWHSVPPAIGNRQQDVSDARLAMRDHTFDPNNLPKTEKWKALFRSSIFASLLVRV